MVFLKRVGLFSLGILAVFSFISLIPREVNADSSPVLTKFAIASRILHADTFGSEIVWLDNGTIKYYDVSTNYTIDVATVSDFYGVAVFSKTILWADKEANDYVVYSYNVLTGSKKQIANLSQVGPLEEGASKISVSEFVSPTFFVYKVESGAWGNMYKQFNVTESKAYGAKDLDGNAVIGDGQEYFKKDSDSKLQYYYANGYFGTSPTKVLIAHSGVENFIDELRIKDVSTGVITDLKNGINFKGSFQNGKLNSERAVFSRYNDGTDAYGYYVLDLKTGNEKKLVGLTSSFMNTPPVGAFEEVDWIGSDALWREIKSDGKYYYHYSAVTDSQCFVGKDFYFFDGDTFSWGKMTDKYYFLQDKMGNLYAQPLICTSETSQANSVVDDTGKLIKMQGNPSVYYLSKNGKRYVFPDYGVYGSWYSNFLSVKTIIPSEMYQIQIGGNVTYKPGTLIKITTDPKVYAVDKGGVLRWIKSETIAKSLYGNDWGRRVKDVMDFLFVNYTFGNSINSVSDYVPSNSANGSPTIDIDKGL
ncbi:MAG: hypothetical protein AUJ23_03250 [Candidatus Magasanikbacteria bacterium CG1_02_32_51]|uniref:Uncharacterized protein n=1 Tax=Candidatus Magasanikbacteria bacterium CG1_02_32_51 TaxID=1805238 RepID=A0A1J4U5X3_9BACT|nr:MAG: hypothetical protein AUJ23_03250 [Candidatus Magasanikbacteria bacterium CG1_02_32_51]